MLNSTPLLVIAVATIISSSVNLVAAEFFELPVSISAVSADGSTLVGSTDSQFDPPSVPMRWTEANGVELLGTLPGLERGIARGVSSNGDLIVGSSFRPSTDQPFIWTEDNGITGMPIPDGTLGAQMGPLR